MNKRKSILICLVLVLILLSGAVFADNALKQKVSWSPETLNLSSLKQGESTTASIVLTNTSVLNQKIEGEHLGFKVTNPNGATISATANFPKKIAPGEKVTVTLVISIASSTPALPPRVISGKVQLVKKDDDKEKKDEKDNGKEKTKLFEKPLFVNITISPFSLPPEPNKAEDEATVAGVDTNANGVRDHTERYIGFTYPDSAKMREGLMQDARVYEMILRDSGDKAATRSHVQEQDDELDCLTYLLNDDLDALDKITDELKANYILDTAERIRANHNANAQFGGMVSGGRYLPINQRKARCSFNPDTLPN